MNVTGLVVGFCIGLITYNIGYLMGRASRKSVPLAVKTKVVSTPAKAIVLKRASRISHGEKMAALCNGKKHEDVLKRYTEDVCDALLKDAKDYVSFRVDSCEDADEDTITGTLVVYDIDKENE